MDENRRNNINKRIDNVLRAMKNAQDYECKLIWNKHLQALIKLKRRKNERFRHQSKLVH